MSKKNLLTGTTMVDVFLDMPPEDVARFGRELTEAIREMKLRKKQDPSLLLNAAFNFGIEVGVKLCRIRGEWSDPRRKKEWCRHFDVEDWRTVAAHVRTREVTKRLAQIHSDDIDKRW